MEKISSKLKPELLGGFLTILMAGLLFAFGEPPRGIEQFINYPNPFDSRREGTTIAYTLPEDAAVRVRIYDLFGYQVKEFSFSAGEMGAHNGANLIQWDGTDGTGDKVSKGGYICRVTVEGSRPVNGIRKIGVIH